jgi:Bor protein.
MKVRSLGLICFIALTNACYHATIDTGLTPSTQTIEKGWASGWIYGLVPPSPVETAQKCPNGVAKVETQLSFANQLVNFLTLGIYTPMEIKVTCAQGRTSSLPIIKAGPDKAAAFEDAARLSFETKQPVLLSY